jgi:NAD(P)H-dependent flavin oxidoreductase YrpB (nitropropane dioxygenase family)
LDDEIIELLIATGFAEVWLAKEGHNGKIFINFLHKIELPLIYVLYGAMLAGVDGVIIGAGNPDRLPALCRQLAQHKAVTHEISVLYREAGEEFALAFDPKQVANGRFAVQPLTTPAFLAIVSLEDLAKALAASKSAPPDGFIIEHHTAGGHNANPIGPLVRDALGQPIYSNKDEADLAAIRGLGIPFWLAGGYGSRVGLQKARAAGATGVQAGTVFALAEESGMKSEYRAAILTALKEGVADADLVRTTVFSPTGFSFKGERVLFQRCPAGPIENFVKNRGVERNTDERRCLCNGLLACVGLGQVKEIQGQMVEEPAIVTLGNHLDGVRRLSRQGQVHYFVQDVVADILG